MPNFFEHTTDIGMIIIYTVVIILICFIIIAFSEIMVDVVIVRIKKIPFLNKNYEYDQRNFYYQDGVLAIGSQDFKEAIRCFSESLILDKNFTLALYARGSMYQKTGEHEKAIIDYQRYLQIKPEDSKVLNNLAMAHYSIGNIAQAKEYIDQSIEHDPHLKEAFHNRGLLAILEANIQNANKDFKKVLELPPKDPKDLIPFAFLEILTKNYENAIQKFNQIEQEYQKNEDPLFLILEENFNNMEILYYRGYCHYKLGNHPQAQQDFAKADAILPHQPLLRYEDLNEEEIFSI
jgi:Tfp pilus assembly protein PilF